MIGLVGIVGYYVLSSGVLTGQTQTAPAPVTYTTPAPAALPTLQNQCETEGGKWQGSCCSCPNKNCTQKCGAQDQAYTNEDVCDTEDGVWQYNQYPQCCSCPNKNCSHKCGSINKTASGGVPAMLDLCEEQNGKWNYGTSSPCNAERSA